MATVKKLYRVVMGVHQKVLSIEYRMWKTFEEFKRKKLGIANPTHCIFHMCITIEYAPPSPVTNGLVW